MVCILPCLLNCSWDGANSPYVVERDPWSTRTLAEVSHIQMLPYLNPLLANDTALWAYSSWNGDLVCIQLSTGIMTVVDNSFDVLSMVMDSNGVVWVLEYGGILHNPGLMENALSAALLHLPASSSSINLLAVNSKGSVVVGNGVGNVLAVHSGDQWSLDTIRRDTNESAIITKLGCTRTGMLWAYFSDGYLAYQHPDSAWQRLWVRDSLAGPFWNLVSLEEDVSGSWWIRSWSDIYTVQDLQGDTIVPRKVGSAYYWLYVDSLGRAAVLSYNAKAHADGDSLVQDSTVTLSSSYGFTVDRQGTVWIGFDAGLYTWKNNAWKQLEFAEPTLNAIPSLLFLDSVKQVWVETGSGLFRREGTFWTRDDPYPAEHAVRGQQVMVASDGNVWAQYGSHIWRRDTHGWTMLSGDTSRVWGYFAEAPDHSIWAFDTSSLVWFRHANSHWEMLAHTRMNIVLPVYSYAEKIQGLAFDSSGTPWVVTGENKLLRLTTKGWEDRTATLPYTLPSHIFQSPKGQLWITSYVQPGLQVLAGNRWIALEPDSTNISHMMQDGVVTFSGSQEVWWNGTFHWWDDPLGWMGKPAILKWSGEAWSSWDLPTAENYIYSMIPLPDSTGQCRILAATLSGLHEYNCN